jgi:ribulose 1,5-bisphosphate synthetase/thiazole synthase
MSTIEAKRTDNAETEELDVVIVGAGFAGLYLLDLSIPKTQTRRY